MRAPRAGELRVLDGHVSALDHPDPLVLGEAAPNVEMHAVTDAANRQGVLDPGRHVTVIDSGLDLYDVAVSRRLRRDARCAQRLFGPHAQHLSPHSEGRRTSRPRARSFLRTR